jgi:hypothetical protein
MFYAKSLHFRSSDYLVHELVQRIEYLQGRMRFEEDKIQKSTDEIKFYIENLKTLDDKVEVC